MRSLMLAAVAVAALLAIAAPIPTAANHTQSDSGKSIAFDHKAGNQWWVEVAVTGADAGKVAKVEAQVGAPWGKAWTNLPKQSWGAYAASFEVGTDSDVRFRATFTDGTQAVSCWFFHPSGTENCSYGPPPGTWRSAVIGQTGTEGFGGESAVADLDHDGVGEVVVAAAEGVFAFEWTGTGWQRTAAALPSGDQDFRLLAIGSTDRDDIPEVYTVGRYYDGQRVVDRLMWHHFNSIDRVWSSEKVWDFASVSDIVIGDLDDDGSDELVAVTYNNQDHNVYSIKRSPGFFGFTQIAQTTYGTNLGRAVVADADRDLDQELYVLQRSDFDSFTGVVRVDFRDGGWAKDVLFAGEFGNDLTGFAGGDGDNDGLDELYLLSTGFFPDEPTTLHRFSVREAGWNQLAIPMGKGFHYDLHLGDGNGDGFDEIYSGTGQGHLAQAMWMGSSWMTRAVAQLGSGEFLFDVSAGDADGDGKSEVYGVSYESPTDLCCPTTHVQRIGLAAGSGTTSSTAGSSGPSHDATFTGVRGNEWWVQAQVSSPSGVAKVDVRLNGGEWKPVTRQSWGWGVSYHIPQGTTVQLRATSPAGAADLSDCYRWIPPSNTDASKVACPGTSTTSTSGGAFDASFSGVKGNDWWVQANVAANQPLAGVDARVNCGTWKPLALQSWGGWAASFHVPAGSKVDFRARSTGGASDLSGGYVWPQATPTSGC